MLRILNPCRSSASLSSWIVTLFELHACFRCYDALVVTDPMSRLHLRVGCGVPVAAACTLLVLIYSSICHLVASQNTNFSFPSFTSTDQFILLGNVNYSADDSSFIIDPAQLLGSGGKLLYKEKVRVSTLHTTGTTLTTASFSTYFTFEITTALLRQQAGDGLAFAFAADNHTLGDEGSSMCLLKQANDGLAKNQLLAVEFDTFRNAYLNDPSDNHIGVDVNSMNSTALYNLCGAGGPPSQQTNCSYLANGGPFTAWVDYNGTGQTLEVRFVNGTYSSGKRPANFTIRVQNLDLGSVFNADYMYVGFSASTGSVSEVHKIRSWSFVSSGMPEINLIGSPSGALSAPDHASTRVNVVALISGVVGGLVAFGVLLVVVFLLCRRREINFKKQQQPENNPTMNYVLGPRRFTYAELRTATKNFSESERLGSGGFGAVYKGILEASGTLVAVKRMSRESQEGEEGFLAEACSISQIRHRNLVQLQGWCHEDGRFLLVYDYMPNRSLDRWLFKKTREARKEDQVEDQNSVPDVLAWDLRYKILGGVAAALSYLHEEWKQCVLHRDIKSSNVMLDADFEAHLGDFGLARLMDHKKVEFTTLMGGTLGYMAPELAITNKATKETDVYSFGVLVIEVVCGKRPLDLVTTEPEDMVLVDTVWRAHEAGNLLSVADARLAITTKPPTSAMVFEVDQEDMFLQSPVSQLRDNAIDSTTSSCYHSFSEFVLPLEPDSVAEEDEKIVTYLLQLGLLCCHPIPEARPSMRLVNQSFHTRDLGVLPPLPSQPPAKHYKWFSETPPSVPSSVDLLSTMSV
jgi:serine/threonine protein kinase